MEELQRLLQSLGKLTNASSAVVQSLERISDSAPEADDGLKSLGTALKKGVGKALSFAGALGSLTNLVIRNVSVQIRLTKSITDLNTQIYKSEDVFASMTAKTEKSFEYMRDIVNINTGGLRAFAQELPIIGDIFKSIEQVGVETMSAVQEQNKQNLAVVQTVSSGVRQLSSNFGVVTLNLTEFSAKAGEAGLNSDQFAKMLSDNTTNLKGAFGGVTDASTVMSQAFKALVTPGSDGLVDLRARFAALGMNTDDIAELFSETAIRQRILTGQQVQSGKALATQSFEYLKSLKGLSAITGEDLKTQQARRRDLLNQANFAAKLEQLRAQERGAEADALFGGVSLTGELFGASAQKLAMEVAVYGRAITQEGAMLAMSNKGLYESIQETIEGTKGFTGSVVEANAQNTAIFDAKKEEIQQSREASNTLAMMSGLTDNQFVQTVGAMFVETRSSVEQLGTLSENFNSSVEAMGTTLDTVTQQIVDQSLLDQKRRAELEGLLFAPGFGDDDPLAQSTVALAGAFGSMAYELTKERIGLVAGITNTTNKFAEFVGDPGVDNFIALAKAVGVISSDQAKEEATRRQIDRIDKSEGQAIMDRNPYAYIGYNNGGIATGPDTGYRAVLHGTEAVVPLPDGKSIPVTLDTTKFDESITSLVQGIGSASNNDNSNLASLMEQSVNLNGQILDTLKQSNRTGKQMVRAIS